MEPCADVPPERGAAALLSRWRVRYHVRPGRHPDSTDAPGMTDFESAVEALIDVGRYCDRRAWVPATSGNLSVRLDGRSAVITVSGAHKGRLGRADLMRVDLDG